MDHVIDGLMLTLHLNIDRGRITTSGLNSGLIVKSEMNDVVRVGKMS